MGFFVCNSVSVVFGSLVAVDHVDLTVEKGAVVGIGGPNGAGKTTFLDLISGLVPMASGTITLDELRLSNLKAHERARAGLSRTFQLNAGFDNMSVFDNVLSAVTYSNRSNSNRRLLYSREDVAHTEEIIATFDLQAVARQMVSELGILNRKKLMIATALASDPKLVLLDEPVGGLTPTEIDAFAELVLSLKSKDHTIIFIEHVMSFLTGVADRALIMDHGSIIYDGDPKEIAHDARVAEVYLGKAAEKMRGNSR